MSARYRLVNPATIAKAQRLAVTARDDGTFDVAGDHGTYRVRKGDDARFVCECQAARADRHCSHVIAVQLRTSPDRNDAPLETV